MGRMELFYNFVCVLKPVQNKLRMEQGITQNNDEKQKALLQCASSSSTMDHGGIISNQEQASVWRMVRKFTSFSSQGKQERKHILE